MQRKMCAYTGRGSLIFGTIGRTKNFGVYYKNNADTRIGLMDSTVPGEAVVGLWES